MLLKKLLTLNLISKHRRIPSHNKVLYRQYSDSAAYDGDGKTTVRVLNNEDINMNLVNTYSGEGFRLSNNLFIHGSILLFPTYVFSWNVRRGIEITPDSLMLFNLIVPKIKIVVIGYGQKGEKYDSSLPMLLKRRGISCELLPTPSAVTTYNFLAADSVHVAGAFVPVRDQVLENQQNLEADMLDSMVQTRDDNRFSHVLKDTIIEIEEGEKKIAEYERRHTDPNKKDFDP